MRLLITGAKGKMGVTLLENADNDKEVESALGIDLGDSLLDALENSNCVIDFSHHGFTKELMAGLVKYKKPLVMGTTGHTNEELEIIKNASKEIAIIHAPNFSVGVNVLFWLTQKTTEIVGNDFDVEITEMHHNMKIDAPSGTAKRLGEVVTKAKELSYEKDVMHGRFGNIGARKKNEVGMHTLRGGDVIGDHSVIYAAGGEMITLSHRATNRNVFSLGAIRASKWLLNQSPGFYSMKDVLGLD